MKTEAEIREKLEEMLALDSRIQPEGMTPGGLTFSKVAACKALLWALGINDNDEWHITAPPGPALDKRLRSRN